MARQIANSFARQRLSRRIPCRIAPRMAADCSFFLSSPDFTTVCMPYCLADRSLDHLFSRSYTALPTVCMPYGSTEGKSAHLWVHSYLPLVDYFANILRAVDCSPYRSCFRSSTSVIPGQFAYCIPQWMAAGCSFLHSSMAFTMVSSPYCSADGYADRSFVRSSMAPTTDSTPYCSADGSGLLILSLVNGFHDGLHAVLLS